MEQAIEQFGRYIGSRYANSATAWHYVHDLRQVRDRAGARLSGIAISKHMQLVPAPCPFEVCARHTPHAVFDPGRGTPWLMAYPPPLEKRDNERSRFVLQLMRFMMNAYHELGHDPPICVLHDPLSAGVCVHPDLVRTERLHVEVETRGQFTRGMTVADRRPRPGKEATVDVALEVDAERFVADFMEALLWWTQQGSGLLA